jgi:hypothetical protein
VALGVSQWMASVGRCWPQAGHNSAEELEPLVQRSDPQERLQDQGVVSPDIGTAPDREEAGLMRPASSLIDLR